MYYVTNETGGVIAVLTDFSADVLEELILSYDPAILNLLLLDHSTHKNIIWASEDYASFGEAYTSEKEIHSGLITGEHTRLVRPRVVKSKDEQESRTREKAEVFTPSWVCNAQNNLVDSEWFGSAQMFNIETEKGWQTQYAPIVFPGTKKKTWKDYVDARRLEIACGEAPYLVSRYDTVTGEMLPIPERIGILDRKLRVVNENTETPEEWFRWVLRAYQSTYGYEFQGDNLLLARENLFVTFLEHYYHRFHLEAPKRMSRRIARVISWNLWQMDALKYVVPYSCHDITKDRGFLSDSTETEPCPGCKTGDYRLHSGVYCRVYNWRRDNALKFIDMIGGK